MLLNDILIENKMRMPDSFKKSIVATFGHLNRDDQMYIIKHIDKFITKETVVYFPYINGNTPSFLVALEQRLKSLNYITKSYDISVDYPVTGRGDIIVANDMSKLYHLLWKDNTDFPFIIKMSSLTFKHPRDLFFAYIQISDFIMSKGLDPFIYGAAMTALAIYYDTIATLTINSNSIELDQAYIIQTQTMSFSYMSQMLKTSVKVRNDAFIQEILLLEMNILTSLVSIKEVIKYVNLLQTPDMVFTISGESKPNLVKDIVRLLDKRSINDPFVANKFETYRSPVIKNRYFIKDDTIQKNNNELLALIENTTREKIKDLIEDTTGVIEDMDNISFDIPETLLTMYALEFSREHPIMLVPIPEDSVIKRDGSDWRHIIHYRDDVLIAFFLKDSPKKLYGIHMYHYNNEDTSCTLVEFTGKENGSYEYIY